MKLLITTQSVDSNDPVLGFFVRWIEEFAKQCEQIEIICLRSGKYSLPSNVQVHTLHSKTKLGRTSELIALSKSLTYDTVFVHMNPEYVVGAGWLWKLRGKKVALWYTHKNVDLKLRIAEKFSDIIFTASKESFRLTSTKVYVMGHGIDTDFFTPNAQVARGREVLSVGRLTKSKRHDLTIEAMQWSERDLWIAGEGPEHKNLEALAKKLSISSRIHLLGGRTQEELRGLYRRSGVMVHTSETGSLDKVVLEALACGCPVVTTNQYFKEFPVTVADAEPRALAIAFDTPHAADAAWVREHHSLEKLIPRIVEKLV